ncbi:MAG: GNAT family N-acetyltransferase [Acidobacteriota bacterium]
MTELAIAGLQASDAVSVGQLLAGDDPDYARYFVAFDGGAPAIAAMIANARRDRYWGIRSAGRLIGIVMLRGLDAGYATPAFGVYIAQSCAGAGLGRLALEFATTWCRLNGYPEIMLSVHPDHTAAVRLYEAAGFRPDGTFTPRGHGIYRKSL